METYRTETIISKDGMISIKDLPFLAGDRVEILVYSRKRKKDDSQERYPLRGLPIKYIKPFENVAENDWLVLG
ncbi:MAG: hypothetical protein U9Q70_05210 [Chloroflexota bacterium]|nr:hypothetical protein [Chloroflexota bacterium]